jgi:hypothetical protein
MKRMLPVMVAVPIMACAVAFASVQTDYDHAIDFARYHTYTWGNVEAKDSLWADRIRQNVDQQLQAKGWRPVSNQADVSVLGLGDSKTQQQEQTFYSGGGWFGPGVATTSTYSERKGVVIVAIFDNKTKKLAWRGTATGGLADNPEKNVGKLSKAVSQMFAKFPPKK